jgi:hypothetical protein
MRLVLATLLAIGLHVAAHGQGAEKKPEGNGQERTKTFEEIFGPSSFEPKPRPNPTDRDSTGNGLADYAKGYEASRSPDFDTKLGTESHSDAIRRAGQFQLYVNGVVDGVYYMSWRWAGFLPFDIPSGVTNGQIYSIVAKYLREHPEQLHRRKEDLVIEALVEAFPRKKAE